MNDSTNQTENRFVILFHQVFDSEALVSVANRRSNCQSKGGDHWDLMFESDGELLTWAVETQPFKTQTCTALQLPNHRLDYLTYEGPISENRGEVKRTLTGSYCIECHDVPATKNETLTQWVLEGRFRLTVFADDLMRQISFQRETGSKWILKMLAENGQSSK